VLLVRTKTGPSLIAGIGLFAAEYIPSGTVVWQFSAAVDFATPPHAKESLHYSYRSKQTGRIITPGDDAKYINHSKKPNLGTRYEMEVEEDVNFALRDIAEGEELTLDYSSFAQEGTDFLELKK
jgi:SET domain-containing protein